MRDQAVDALLKIHIELAQHDYEQRQRENPNWLEMVPPDDQARVIIRAIRSLQAGRDLCPGEKDLAQLMSGRDAWETKSVRLQRQVDTLEAEIETLKRELTERAQVAAREPITEQSKWKEDSTSTPQVIIQPTQSQASSPSERLPMVIQREHQWVGPTIKVAQMIANMPDRNWPNWMQKLIPRDRRVLVKNATMIWLIGTSGLGRRQILQLVYRKARESFDLLGKERNIITGSDRTSLAALGLVTVDNARIGLIGNTTHLVELTELGEDCYRELFGRTPSRSELALHRRHHHNNQHVLLILEAADLFSDAGYEVLISPDPLEGDQDTYNADLRLISPQGEVLYVEAERGGVKNREERRKKWFRCLHTTAGKINLVTASKSEMESIRSELMRSIRQPCQIRLTNINQARALSSLDVSQVWLE